MYTFLLQQKSLSARESGGGGIEFDSRGLIIKMFVCVCVFVNARVYLREYKKRPLTAMLNQQNVCTYYCECLTGTDQCPSGMQRL